MHKIKRAVTLIEILVATVIIGTVLVSLMTVTVFSKAVLTRELRRLQTVSEADGILERAVFDLDYTDSLITAGVARAITRGTSPTLYPVDTVFWNGTSEDFSVRRTITVVDKRRAGFSQLSWVHQVSGAGPPLPPIGVNCNYKEITVKLSWVEPYQTNDTDVQGRETATVVSFKSEI